MTDDELQRILRRLPRRKAKPPQTFRAGDAVLVRSGPFASFPGRVTEVNADNSTLEVVVKIFGRPTPVGLNFSDVEKD